MEIVMAFDCPKLWKIIQKETDFQRDNGISSRDMQDGILDERKIAILSKACDLFASNFN